jgi:hypothetical protein
MTDSIAAHQRPPPGTLCLDHISHFVPDLDAAGTLLESLGFVVTPLSVQMTPDGPAGSSNRCVMLEEGYLEILTPTHDTPVGRQMRAFMAGHTGVHLACFGTPSADEEHVRLSAHGFEPLPIVRLSRPVDDDMTARFNVVRVPPEKMPEGRIQFVEQLAPEAIWRESHLAHGNGVLGLQAVFVVADDPVAVAARYARFSALLPRRDGAFARLSSERGDVVIGTREQWIDALGAAPAAPSLAGYALKCRDPASFAARCETAGLAVRKDPARLAVRLPPALGGAWILQ